MLDKDEKGLTQSNLASRRPERPFPSYLQDQPNAEYSVTTRVLWRLRSLCASSRHIRMFPYLFHPHRVVFDHAADEALRLQGGARKSSGKLQFLINNGRPVSIWDSHSIVLVRTPADSPGIRADQIYQVQSFSGLLRNSRSTEDS